MYLKRPLLINLAAGLVIFIFLLNLLAHFLYWYSAIWWFDMLMHTLGGVFLGLWALWYEAKILHTKTLRELFLMVMVPVLLLGVAWEGYEYLVQFFIKNVMIANLPDSVSDLACDLLGGMLVFVFVLLLQKRYNGSDGQ